MNDKNLVSMFSIVGFVGIISFVCGLLAKEKPILYIALFFCILSFVVCFLALIIFGIQDKDKDNK